VTDLIALNGRLLASIKADDYAGHDPFDFLNSRLFQATPLNQNRIARLVWLQLGKHLPINLRPLLQVPKMRNPKGIALCLAGLLQDYRRTSRPEFLDEAKRLGPWLISQRSDPELWQSPCWGYHFDWQARAFHVPAGKPNIITTCYVARALYALGQQTADSRLMELALSSARFMADHLYTEHDGQAFYAYIPGETAFVHNASLWGAAWCAFAGHQTGRVDLVDQAMRVTRETVSAQSADGSWVYGTRKHHQFVDSFHTGFNLEALCLIRDVTRSVEFDDCIRRGYDYYVSTFITSTGDINYYKTSTYPLDMHSVAQAVITLLTTGNGPTARKQSTLILSRAIERLYQPARDRFVYQKHRWLTNRINYTRWTQAWAYYALAFYHRYCAEPSNATN
jgi:hypothetical protein